MSAPAARAHDSAHVSIGQVAALTGVPAKTIRYYEQVGVLPPAERAANGYRLYDERAVRVLRFVQRARSLGFGLERVAELLALWLDHSRHSADVRAIATAQLAVIDDKIAALGSMRRQLVHLIGRCHGDERPDCPILDELSGQSGAPEPPPRPTNHSEEPS